MSSYYNEFDKFAAAWLRELIKDGQIPDGEVDERDIRDVYPDDLKDFAQCHFFAGIGGWALALRLAGWPDDRPVWTGSCPCQPFSAAGRGDGGLDERHLWPAWFHLIDGCRPPVVFGEQVEAAIKFGWLDLVSDDLEGIGYAVAPVGLPAASVGAFHIRQRLWFVAHSEDVRRGTGSDSGRVWPSDQQEQFADLQRQPSGQGPFIDVAEPSYSEQSSNEVAVRRGEGSQVQSGGGGVPDTVGDSLGAGLERLSRDGRDGHEPGRERTHAAGSTPETGGTGELADAERKRARRGGQDQAGSPNKEPGTRRELPSAIREDSPSGRGGLADTEGQRINRTVRDDGRAGGQGHEGEQKFDADGESGLMGDTDERRCDRSGESESGGIEGSRGELADGSSTRRSGTSAWSDVIWLPCRDGKARPTQPGLQPLAHGVSNRVGTLRGAGNAIVPQVAQVFIEAYLKASGPQ